MDALCANKKALGKLSMSRLFKMDSNIWLRISRHLGTLLYYIVYPVILLLWSLSSLLLSLFGTILAPFVYVGGVSLYVIGAPFRFLAKFEVSLVLLVRSYRGLNVS